MSNKTVQMAIEGMTCDHCAVTIQRALAKLPGVEHASVSFPEKRASIETAQADPQGLVRAVEGAGYQARVIEPPPQGHASSRPTARRSSAEKVDLAVLGGGSGGFAAAIHAADLGARVTLIEGGTLGGTCVNVGCVPSKTLLRAAEVRHRARHHPFAGVRTAAADLEFRTVIAEKDALVTTLRQEKYWDVLSAYPNVTLRQSRGTLLADLSVNVDGELLKPDRIIVTTGASPWAPPIPGLNEAGSLTSTDALALTGLPGSMVVIGGSAVGLEIAQLYARLGSRVTVLEAMPALVPAEDADVGPALAEYLRDEGLDVWTAVSISRVSRDASGYTIEAIVEKQARTFRADELLVATGRRANTRGFGLEEAGVQVGSKGEIRVNEHLQTTRPEIYAAGDVIGDPMFVYVAAYGGHLAAENALNGNSRRYDLSALPRVTFTDPQVSSVGLTEAQARAQGVDFVVSKLPLAYVPRALAARETRGFIKLLADRGTNRLVGAHILATEAGEMIQEPALAIRHGLGVDDLASAFHPYLTLAEGIKLAAQTFTKDVKKLSCCAA